MFLYQNVNASKAKEKMKAGLQKLVSTLDEATREAAETEKIKQIKTFGQMLKLDTNKDVMYFPGLWKGAPPMAPVDPTYCEKAEDAKKILLETLRSGLPTLTFKEFVDNIDELWCAIMSENFVFNFKNGLHIKAYDALEKEFRNITTSFQDILSKVRREKETLLNKNKGKDNLKQICSSSVFELKEKGRKYQDEQKNKLKTFFAEHHFLTFWRNGVFQN